MMGPMMMTRIKLSPNALKNWLATLDLVYWGDLDTHGFAIMNRLRSRLKDLLHDAHDDFLPGTQYGEWFTPDRNLIRNALGPIKA